MARTVVTLQRGVSPPPVRNALKRKAAAYETDVKSPAQTAAAVEAGQVKIQDHLQYFYDGLSKVRRSMIAGYPSLEMRVFRDLYVRNRHSGGHHFVVHQHDHPVSGVHYDLRLQFSETSSLSFSIPYGLPGNPNSLRPNRMAIETRVHNVWNNLIESASHATGSLLIWDTGEYEVCNRPAKKRKLQQTDDERSGASGDESVTSEMPAGRNEAEKLKLAFQDRHMHLRLHGTRLPAGYTITMRLPRQNDRDQQPRAPKRRRRRVDPAAKAKKDHIMTDSDSSTSVAASASPKVARDEAIAANQAAVASDDESRGGAEREMIRKSNAYPGATNSVGSVHQRHWFLSLDREQSGFVKQRSGSDKGRWVRKERANGTRAGFETFAVRGRDVERSVVTGRTAWDVMQDAGVKGFKGRKMWRAVTE